jgi:hypothetical protein
MQVLGRWNARFILHKLFATGNLATSDTATLRQRHGKANPVTAPTASPALHKRKTGSAWK